VFLTLIALALLELRFQDRQKEWRLLHKKAISWLRKQKVQDVEEVVDQLKAALQLK